MRYRNTARVVEAVTLPIALRRSRREALPVYARPMGEIGQWWRAMHEELAVIDFRLTLEVDRARQELTALAHACRDAVVQGWEDLVQPVKE